MSWINLPHPNPPLEKGRESIHCKGDAWLRASARYAAKARGRESVHCKGDTWLPSPARGRVGDGVKLLDKHCILIALWVSSIQTQYLLEKQHVSHLYFLQPQKLDLCPQTGGRAAAVRL
jgi:hypothetical protein